MTLPARPFAALLALALHVHAPAHGGSPVWRGPQESAPPPQSSAPLSPAGEAPTVGMPGRWNDLVLPGSELEALVRDRKAPAAVRIVATRPHGDSFRYDLEYWGLEPGEHDLRTLLQRKDGSSTSDLPPLVVRVRAAIAEEGLKLPNAPQPAALPRLGGYERLLIAGGVLWVLGLGWIVVSGRKRRAAQRDAAPRARTLAERLRPLVERAMRGELSREERAQLELSLVALWRRRLGLESRRPGEVLGLLRAHPDAGPLLVKLEEWLHRPDPRGGDDIPGLLAPYRELAEDALDTAGRGG